MDITKLAVVDSRIVQEKPAFAVEKGALSITNAPFQAISKSPSQHTFQVNVPSLNTFVNRQFNWTCEPLVALTVRMEADANGDFPAASNTTPILAFGVNSALAPYPLHSMVSTQTATINDAVVSLNVADTLHEIVRLVDRPENRAMKTSPSMLDDYAKYADAALKLNSPLAGYGNALDPENVPNGAWEIQYCNPDGAVLSGNSTYTYNGVQMTVEDGVPVRAANGAAGHMGEFQYIFLRFKLTEKLILSPFIFNEECGDETGFYGVNNVQCVMNMKAQHNRLVRTAADAVRSVECSVKEFVSSTLNVEFMTPNLSVPLPSSNVVAFTEYPRYITPYGSALVASRQSAELQSNTFTLPQIPDAFVIYAKKNDLSALEGDFYLPIEKLNITFNNFTGLLSAHTKEQLFRISYDNGLKMDYLQWSGRANKGEPQVDQNVGYTVATTGGFIVCRPSRDIALQAGEAPGLVGSYTFQANATVRNNTDEDITGYSLYVIAVNSGFFETQSGSSRIVKGVLTESDVINAPMAEAPSRSSMERVVGGGFLSKLGNALYKAVSLKPVRDLAKMGLRKAGPKGAMAADAAEALGLGMAGAARTGGRKSKKAMLSALM